MEEQVRGVKGAVEYGDFALIPPALVGGDAY